MHDRVSSVQPISGALRQAHLAPMPTVLGGESAADYEALRARVAALVRPVDVLEEILVGEVVDLAWDAARLRRLRVRFIESSRHRGVLQILTGFVDTLQAWQLAAGWALREPAATRRVDEILVTAGFTADDILAHAVTFRIEELDRLDRMIASAEARRSAALQEIERHRTRLARDLRRATDVEEAEFEVVAPDGAAHD